MLAVLAAPVLDLSLLLVDVGHVELEDPHVEEGLAAESALQVEQVGNWLTVHCHVQNFHLFWELFVPIVNMGVSFRRCLELRITKLTFQVVLDRSLAHRPLLGNVQFFVHLQFVVLQNIFVHKPQVAI